MSRFIINQSLINQKIINNFQIHLTIRSKNLVPLNRKSKTFLNFNR